jgi:iron(III) transport system ATP-binding protein
MVSITIQRVSKAFGEVRAVDDVSLRVETGELFFLLGPSGCGKTTLLRLVAGFYQPDSGRIFFDGSDVTLVPPHRRNTGMVFQSYALWPHMSVRENLEFGLEVRHLPAAEREQRVRRALEIVQMSEYAARAPNQLSGGEQQRVALARALVLEPDAVLMDEPLSNLDAKLRLEMREQIRRIHDRLGLTMLYVTHDQAEALTMADRIAIMRQGRIIQIGTPREIYSRPASRFVADFVGKTNLLKGRLSAVGEPAAVETAVGRLLSSQAHPGAKVGDTVYCSIRPEHLRILEPGTARANVLAGEVLRAVYLGDHEEYFLKLPDGTELKAVEYGRGLPRAEAGKTARLGCDPADVVLLGEED